MSCPPDEIHARYVDGELAREEVRRVEAHLIGCRSCRAVVLALREESGARADRRAGIAAAPADPGAEAAAPHGRGRALALALTLLALAAAAAALVAALESGLPGSIGSLGGPPWSGRGAYAMALDLVFVAREAAPAVFDLLLPVAAMASVSALLSFALSALRRRIGGPGAKALAALALLAAPGESRAHFGFHEHEDVTVAAQSIHHGTLVASARSVTVDGIVDGDLVVLTERLTLRGEVRGNLFAIARELDLRGVVHGSLFAAGERSSLGGEVRGDAYAAGEIFRLEPGGRLERDATLIADQVMLEGSLGRDANVLFAERVEARGTLGRHLRARAGSVQLLDAARIGGDVEAILPAATAVERAPGAVVGGEVRTTPRLAPAGALDRFRSPEIYAWMLLHVGSGFVLGMLLHVLWPGILTVRAEGPRDLVRAVGIGIATLVLAPVALILAAVTVVGIPVALIGAAALLSAMYVALIAVSGLVGAALVRPRDGSRSGFGAALAAGLAILVVLTHLPFLGDALRIVAVLTGLGLLTERALAALRGRREPAGS